MISTKWNIIYAIKVVQKLYLSRFYDMFVNQYKTASCSFILHNVCTLSGIFSIFFITYY